MNLHFQTIMRIAREAFEETEGQSWDSASAETKKEYAKRAHEAVDTEEGVDDYAAAVLRKAAEAKGA